MRQYTLIETCDPFESRDVMQSYELAENLCRNGDQVTLFLVQNGVFAARECEQSGPLVKLAEMGVEILADEFSLVERGISPARLVSGVSPAALDVVVDHLADGRKTIWN